MEEVPVTRTLNDLFPAAANSRNTYLIAQMPAKVPFNSLGLIPVV